MVFDSNGLSLDDLLARLQRALHIQFFNTPNGRLTTSQLFVMRYLAKRDQAKASQIAKVAGLSPGAVTQVCDELVRLGYVDRARSDKDRRVVYVMLTDAGHNELAAIRKRRADRMNELMTQLKDDDVEHFVRVLHQVVEILEHAETDKGGDTPE